VRVSAAQAGYVAALINGTRQIMSDKPCGNEYVAHPNANHQMKFART